MAIHGWSGDCQSNSGVRGYSDIGGYSSGYPWRVAIHGRSGDCQSNSGVRGYSDTGEYMSGNTCTTLDCQSNSGLQSGGQT